MSITLSTFSLFISSFLSDLSGTLSDLSSEIKFAGKSDCEQTEMRGIVAEWLRCQIAKLEVRGSSHKAMFAPIKYLYPTPLLSSIAPACHLRAIHPTIAGLYGFLFSRLDFGFLVSSH